MALFPKSDGKSDKELLRELTDNYKEMSNELERISEAGLELAYVLAIDDKWAILTNGIYAVNDDYKAGQPVLIYPRTGQVVKARDDAPLIGDLHIIDKIKGKTVEIRVKGERRLIGRGKFKDNLNEGDIVLLDSSCKMVTALVERPKTMPKVSKQITWDMIGGNKEAKQLMIEAIELPHKYGKHYKHYNQQSTKGILLKGPPGVGKTMLCKAAATAIGSEDGFILIKGPEILDPYVGVAEANIRAAFIRAKAFKHRANRPAVLVIDEAESLLTHRSAMYNHMGQTVVPTFLTEMDGIDESSAIVILSTNRDDMLDPAVIREGRVDFKVEVGRPTLDEAKEIMAIHINGKPINKGEDYDGLVEWGVQLLYQFENLPFSGALIAGTVNKATTSALRRDIASGRLSGLGKDDFTWAVTQIVKQELNLTTKGGTSETENA